MQKDAQIIIYSYSITFLYMFPAINAHLQEVTLYTCSIWYCHSKSGRGGRSVHRLSENSRSHCIHAAYGTVPSLSKSGRGGPSVHRLSENSRSHCIHAA